MASAATRWTACAVSWVAALPLSLLLAATASADPDDAPATEAPVASTPESGQVLVAAPVADGAAPAAVAACGRYATVLQGTAVYYDNFAEALETYAQPEYREVIRNSNTLGRTALREGAAEALSAANTPGLAPAIAAPMRSWSLGATKLLIKMGLRGTGDTLDTTVAEMNNDAYAVQLACAAAGTHA
ncbi:MAG: hypothetical protein SW019_12970 [Actinomycetota bacterium]|nr:hypothetical protein [Actinomycetota bacterium]